MVDKSKSEIAALEARVLALECLLTAMLDTLVSRGRVAHSDIALILEAASTRLAGTGTVTDQAGSRGNTEQARRQFEYYRTALRL